MTAGRTGGEERRGAGRAGEGGFAPKTTRGTGSAINGHWFRPTGQPLDRADMPQQIGVEREVRRGGQP